MIMAQTSGLEDKMDSDRIVHPWWACVLQCPDCRGEFVNDSTPTCSRCGYQPKEANDFRPSHPELRNVSFAPLLNCDPAMSLQAIETSRPALTYSGPMPGRDSRELFSVLSPLPMGRLLDLGCGPRDQATPAQHMGFEYVGADVSGNAPDLLADAHALPFRNNSFDAVLSYAVLEHLHQPFLALEEISRILKPGGSFVGTVSQGEPFHASFFHLTAYGLLSLVASQPDLKVARLWASHDTLASLSQMGRYPRVTRIFIGLLNKFDSLTPWLAPRKQMWPAKEKEIDRIHRAGSICFHMRKSFPC